MPVSSLASSRLIYVLRKKVRESERRSPDLVDRGNGQKYAGSRKKITEWTILRDLFGTKKSALVP